MSELEKELQQMEAQYGKEFGDASESEEEESVDGQEKTNGGEGRAARHFVWASLVLIWCTFINA